MMTEIEITYTILKNVPDEVIEMFGTVKT